MAITQGRRGRPSKPYRASWGESIDGLRREADGRWRIVATRDAFTEPDERLAVARFRALQDRQDDRIIRLRHPPAESGSADALAKFMRAMDEPGAQFSITTPADGSLPIGNLETLAPSGAFWSTVRRLLIDHPRLVADMTGIAQVAALAELPMPRPSLKLEDLREVYRSHATTKPQGKAEALAAFDQFVKLTNAATLADLTADACKTYRAAMLAAGNMPTTTAAYFSRVKTIIRFAKSEGEDAAQIDAALSRMAVLKAPKDARVKKPTPVAPADFHALLSHATGKLAAWYPRLLLALNLCLHLDELLSVRWDELDLSAGTFISERSKTGVIRAATLWPETIAALKAIQRRGPYVFTSKQGGKFASRGQWKTWEALRTAAGCPDVQFDDIRDGAYSAACNAPGVDEKFARLLAGHASRGLQDNYVRRNPAVVRPACEAVHAAYFGL